MAVAVPWLVFNGAVAAAFLAVLVTSAGAQAEHSLAYMQNYWRESFPPLADPARLPGWLTWVHTGEMMAYPAGSRSGGSTLTFLACALGLAWLVRGRHWPLCVLALAPLALNLLAAAIQRYPYGSQTRLTLYHAPWFCLLAALGGWAFVAGLSRWRLCAGRQELHVRLAVCMLLMIPAGIMALDIAYPFKDRSDQRARDFARWFWIDVPSQCEVACVRSDLGQEFHPAVRDEMSWMSMYLCNQRIYSPRHAIGKPPAWDQVSAERPLWCLDFVPSGLPRDTQAEAAWLASMQERYELIGELQFPFAHHSRHETRIKSQDYVKVWQFRPHADATAARENPAGSTTQRR